MKLDLRLVTGAGAVLLAGYALYLLVRPPPAVEEAQRAWASADGEPVDARLEAQEERQRLAVVARGGLDRAGEAELPVDDLDVAPPSGMAVPGGEVTPESARAGFDYAMRRVEKLGSRRRRLRRAQWDAIYREANDAYAALAIALDASDEAELRELEAAHVRLKEGLRAVRVRGDKFAP